MSDHILSLLQGELSRETGAELHSLSSGLAELHDTLCGNVVRFAHTVASYDPSHRCRQPANLPLFRLPFGMESSIGGPTAVGIGLRTSKVPGSRCGEFFSSACSRTMGWSEGRSEGRGGNGREGAWGRPTRRAYGNGPGDSASDGSINHGKADEDAEDELGAGDAEEEEGEEGDPRRE